MRKLLLLSIVLIAISNPANANYNSVGRWCVEDDPGDPYNNFEAILDSFDDGTWGVATRYRDSRTGGNRLMAEGDGRFAVLYGPEDEWGFYNWGDTIQIDPDSGDLHIYRDGALRMTAPQMSLQEILVYRHPRLADESCLIRLLPWEGD